MIRAVNFIAFLIFGFLWSREYAKFVIQQKPVAIPEQTSQTLIDSIWSDDVKSQKRPKSCRKESNPRNSV